MSPRFWSFRRRIGVASANPTSGEVGATVLTLLTQPSSTVASAANIATRPVIQLRDSNGVAVAQAGVAITVTLNGGGTLDLTPTTATTDSLGRATWTTLIITGTTGSRTLSFSATGFVGVTSSTINVTPGAASPTNSTASVPPGSVGVQTTITVQARDTANNGLTVGGESVSGSIQSGSVNFGTTITTTDNSNGTYSLRYTPSSQGTDTIAINMNGIAISGSPYTSIVGGLFRSENFDLYVGVDDAAKTTHWRSNPFGWMGSNPPSYFHQEQFHIDTAELTPEGKPSLRADWPGPGVSQLSSGLDRWGGCFANQEIDARYLFPTLAEGGGEVWFRILHKFAANWDDRGYKQVDNGDGTWGPFIQPLTQCTASEYKFLLFFPNTGSRFDLINGHSASSWWAASPQTPKEDDTIAICKDAQGGGHCSGGGNGCNNQLGWGDNLDDQTQYRTLIGNIGKQWDGQWHEYWVHLKMSQSDTDFTGKYEIWIDGQKVLGRYNRLTKGAVDGILVRRIFTVALGSNCNSGTKEATSSWWGGIRIYTTNPGWPGQL